MRVGVNLDPVEMVVLWNVQIRRMRQYISSLIGLGVQIRRKRRLTYVRI